MLYIYIYIERERERERLVCGKANSEKTLCYTSEYYIEVTGYRCFKLL